MTTTRDPTEPQTGALLRAQRASRATYARRRHAKWFKELRECGVLIHVPPEYTGLPLVPRSAEQSVEQEDVWLRPS